MRLAFIALVVLAFVLPAAMAATDNFDYAAFNIKALKELQLEEQFFNEMANAPKEATTVFGIIPAVAEDDIP
ncbi:hypothetical protein HY994_02785 [Candidatus Micrarchaeota archaeon]|nr:hypothetical protein [Candidatus Micrarchaeota archaeon]